MDRQDSLRAMLAFAVETMQDEPRYTVPLRSG